MLICILTNFFFQAEDGIRDGHVTGVQTCALPIYIRAYSGMLKAGSYIYNSTKGSRERIGRLLQMHANKIGRASCREREEIKVVVLVMKKKKWASGYYVDGTHRTSL